MEFSRIVVKIILLIGAVFLGVAPNDALATHFRYGHLTWRVRADIGPNVVDITFNVALRRCGYRGSGVDGCPVIGDIISEDIGATSIIFGDGTVAPVSGSIQVRVTAYDAGSDWIIGTAIDPITGSSSLRHTYPAQNNLGNPWVAAVSSCCRLSNLQNAPDGAYRVETFIDIAQTVGSPVSSLPPIVACQQGAICRFLVPAAAPTAAPVTWRLATSSENGGINQPNLLSVDSGTGVVTWDATAVQLNSLWTAQVVIESRDSVSGSMVGKSAVDFLLLIVPSGIPPVITPPPNSPPICNTSVPAMVGREVKFTVAAADPDPADIVTLNTAGLPPRASMSPSLPLAGNPVSSTFVWIPSKDDVGTAIVNFSAADRLGLQTLCPITIQIVETPIGISVGGSSAGALAPGQTNVKPALNSKRSGVLLTYSSTSDYNVLLPGPVISRVVNGDSGTFDVVVQSNWKAWYYVTLTPFGSVGQTAPSAFVVPPGENRTFRATFQRGDRLSLFASAGFRVPPQDTQDEIMATLFGLDFFYRVISGSSTPYNVISAIEKSYGNIAKILSPFAKLGYDIGSCATLSTCNALSIPKDVAAILSDEQLVKALVSLGVSEAALDQAKIVAKTLGFGVRLYRILELLAFEFIAATSRPFGDLTYEAR